jgi:NAD(P)-dependent dehydrogenase (short-subunit alcohol dehydrogenase family)
MIAIAGVIAGRVPFWEMPLEQEAAVLDGNFTSVLVAARTAIPALLRRPEPRAGRFVAVASAAVTRGLPRLAAYCATKAGITGLVRALAADLQRNQRHRQLRQPRIHRYPSPQRKRPAIQPRSRRGILPTATDRSPITPDEVAATIAWLVDRSTAAITGASIPVDGGLAL